MGRTIVGDESLMGDLRLIGVLLAAVAALLGGCAGSAPALPVVNVPPNWQTRPGAAAASAWPDREWWKGFGSAELDALIAEAQANNHDLKAAGARVDQARAEARVVGAALFPSLFFDVQASREKKKPDGKVANLFALGPSAAYEVDLWGRNRSARDAAAAGVQASRYAEEDVRLALTAGVAGTYLQILSLNDRLRTAEAGLANAQRLLAIVESQHTAGRVSALEEESQQAQVAIQQAIIPPLQQQLQVARGALAVLLGRTQGRFEVASKSLRPVRPPEVPLGLPAVLLRRRPDIREAEAALAAADANVAAARAALFPQLDLTASGGSAAQRASQLFKAGSGFFAIGADLLATIFDGGRRSGVVELTQAQRRELVEAYLRSIDSALRDVEDALASVEQFGLQEQVQQQAVLHAHEAYRLAEIRYKAGSADYLTVLDAQRTMINAELAEDGARFAHFAAIVDLYRALGGGWSEASAPRGSSNLPQNLTLRADASQGRR
jgi:outer membrane protein, multidrug efflux system